MNLEGRSDRRTTFDDSSFAAAPYAPRPPRKLAAPKNEDVPRKSAPSVSERRILSTLLPSRRALRNTGETEHTGSTHERLRNGRTFVRGQNPRSSLSLILSRLHDSCYLLQHKQVPNHEQTRVCIGRLAAQKLSGVEEGYTARRHGFLCHVGEYHRLSDRSESKEYAIQRSFIGGEGGIKPRTLTKS